MKIIEQSVTSYKQEDFTLECAYKAVERAARICYNSTDKITDGSYKPFIKMLRKNKHTAPFAFGTVHIYVPNGSIITSNSYRNKITGKELYTLESDVKEFFDRLPDSWARVYENEGETFITTNLRVLEEWQYDTPFGYKDVLEAIKYFIVDKDDKDQKFYDARLFVICTTSIAMSREFNRYSSLSICERSSRYVQADQIIKPCWFGNDDNNDWAFEDIANIIYNAYYDLMNSGYTVLKKQEARDILPLCTATEVAYIGFEDDWNWIINQRTSNGAHPQAQELARMIKREIYNDSK